MSRLLPGDATRTAAAPPLPPAGRDEPFPLPAVLAIAVIGFALRFGVAILSPSVARPDEIFQNLEPGYRLLTGTGIVTWEWREGIRSVMMPGFLAGLMAAGRWLTSAPAGYLPVVWGSLAALAALTIPVAAWIVWRQAGRLAAIVCAVAIAVWPDLVWLGPKTLAEVQAGNLLVLAMGLAIRAAGDRAAADPLAAALPRGAWYRLVALGACVGVIFAIRFHIAPALAVVCIWACGAEIRRAWLPLLLGAALPMALLGVTDHLAWGSPFHSVWQSIAVNVGQGVSREFGEEPVGWYLAIYAHLWGPGLPIVLGLFVLGLRAGVLPALVAAAVVLPHLLLAHKEIFFVYAAIAPMLIVAALGSVRLAAALRGGALLLRPWGRLALVGGWIAMAGMVATWPGFAPFWSQLSGPLHAAALLREREDLCGFATVGEATAFAFTGGHVFLDRDVPFHWFRDARAWSQASDAANYVLTDRGMLSAMQSSSPQGLRVEQCWLETAGGFERCLVRVEIGACRPSPRHLLNNNPLLGRPAGYRDP